MAGIDGVNDVVLNFLRQLILWSLHLFGKELYATLDGLVFIGEAGLPLFDKFLDSLYVLAWNGYYGLCLEWYGVAHVSSVP